MEDIQEVLKSICVTDEEVKKVVTTIREDIVPKFRDKVMMIGEKILVRKIFVKENEKTKSGVLIIQGATNNIDQQNFYSTHPFQGVVVKVPENLNLLLEVNMDLNIHEGDHVLCKNEIPSDQLSRGGVIIDGYIFGYIFFTDIICKL